MRGLGVRNLIWRTPGSDGGRDIEGEVAVTDLIGVDRTEKWYVECKRYNSSIDWPTIWKKVAYGDSHCADVFVLATNSNPSPNCESEISNWNGRNRTPRIRVIRGYSFEEILSTRSHLKLCHGLESSDVEISHQALSFSRLIMGVVQAAFSSEEFGQNSKIALETATIFTELHEQRLSEIATHGYFGSGRMCGNVDRLSPEWLICNGNYSEIEEIAYSATTIGLLYFSGAKTISTDASGKSYTFILGEPKFPINKEDSHLILLLEWACAEIETIGAHGSCGKINFRIRQ